MSRYAVVVMLPEPEDDPSRQDFVSREFEDWSQIGEFMAEVEARAPKWRLVSFCHVEDLPMLMEPPK